MSTFEDAFSATMKREGGYVLHTVVGDLGGQTYAGIARKFNAQWEGWNYIDRGETPPTTLVRNFYFSGYWEAIRASEYPYPIAASLYDFAVNTSAPGNPVTAIKIAQAVLGVETDGILGPKSIAALNAIAPKDFHINFFIAKLRRYIEICVRNPTQLRFLIGWLNRSILVLKDSL